MQNGWIKIHRKIQDKGYFKRSAYVHLWLCLLLKANHEKKEFMWNGEIIMVKAGQLITGRKELSAQTGIPETTIERILDFFKNEHQIEQQKTNKYRLITIVKWGSYQNMDINSDNKRTTSGHKQELKELKEIYNSQKEEKIPKIDMDKYRPDFIRKPKRLANA